MTQNALIGKQLVDPLHSIEMFTDVSDYSIQFVLIYYDYNQ